MRCSIPMRTSICGGASDLPACYPYHGGYLISAAIDKYVTLEVFPMDTMSKDVSWKICNHLVPERYAEAVGFGYDQCLISCESDFPPGSGLGGSGALMVGLLKLKHPELSKYELASAAYNIERFSLGHPTGCQDHFIAAFGGVLELTISQNGFVYPKPIELPKGFVDQLILFSTGIQRDAKEVLTKQQESIKENRAADESIVEILDISARISEDLKYGGKQFGELTERHWQAKRQTSMATTTPQIDAWHDLALDNGATGFKCNGAGAGGTVMVVCHPDDRQHLIKVLESDGLVHVPFNFVDRGAEIVG